MSVKVRFVHMKKDEIEIAKRFLALVKDAKRIETSVKLYPPEHFVEKQLLEAAEEYAKLNNISVETALKLFEQFKMRKQILENMAKRIDIVVEFEHEIWLVELKDKFRPSGLGELFVYKYWYRKQFKPKKKIRLIFVAERDDIMVREAAAYYGIKCILV